MNHSFSLSSSLQTVNSTAGKEPSCVSGPYDASPTKVLFAEKNKQHQPSLIGCMVLSKHQFVFVLSVVSSYLRCCGEIHLCRSESGKWAGKFKAKCYWFNLWCMFSFLYTMVITCRLILWSSVIRERHDFTLSLWCLILCQTNLKLQVTQSRISFSPFLCLCVLAVYFLLSVSTHFCFPLTSCYYLRADHQFLHTLWRFLLPWLSDPRVPASGCGIIQDLIQQESGHHWGQGL